MALKLRRTSASRVKLLSTFIAVFALLAQPMYGLVESRVANALNGVAPTIQPCLVTNTVNTTSLSTWNLSETRANGHNVIAANGLHIWTDSNTSTDKAAGYLPASFDLKDLGEGFGVTTASGSGTLPSLQLLTDIDNDGQPDGYLVGEPASYGANSLWLSANWHGVDLSGAPTTLVSGGGTGYNGHVNEWLAAFPDAKVSAIGYSLGSGVHGDYVISNISAGCTNYTFALDNVMPDFDILTPSNGTTVRGTQKIIAKVSDPSGITKVLMSIKKKDGNSLSYSWAPTGNSSLTKVGDTYSVDVDTTLLADGATYVTLRGTDSAGNTRYWNNNTANRQHVFTVDNTFPSISVSSSLGDMATKTFREVSFKLHDSGKIDRAVLNDRPFTSSHGSVWGDLNNVWANRGWSGAVEGENTLVLLDMAGNQVSYVFTIDRTAPSVVSYAYSNNHNLTKDDVTVTIKTSEPIQTPNGWTQGAESTQFTKVFDHNGEFFIDLEDMVGNTANVGGKKDGAEVKGIDRNAPTISGVNNGTTVQGPVTLEIFDPKFEGFDGFDKNHGLIVNGQKVQATETSGKKYTYTISSDGTYEIVAADKAGNSTTLTFMIDSLAPVLTMGAPTLNADGTYTIRGTTSDKDAPVMISTNGGVPVSALIGSMQTNGTWAWSFSLGELLAGRVYTFTATSSDGVQNAATARTVTFNVPAVDAVPVSDPGFGPVANPASIFANAFTGTPFANDQAVQADTDVLGARDEGEQKPAVTVAVIEPSAQGWKLFGLAWFWWVLLGAAIAAGWWMIAAARRRRDENAY